MLAGPVDRGYAWHSLVRPIRFRKSAGPLKTLRSQGIGTLRSAAAARPPYRSSTTDSTRVTPGVLTIVSKLA
jgi:hypothetical protein